MADIIMRVRPANKALWFLMIPSLTGRDEMKCEKMPFVGYGYENDGRVNRTAGFLLPGHVDRRTSFSFLSFFFQWHADRLSPESQSSYQLRSR